MELFFPQKGDTEVNENVFEIHCCNDSTLLYIIYGCVDFSSMLVVALTIEMVRKLRFWEKQLGSGRRFRKTRTCHFLERIKDFLFKV